MNLKKHIRGKKFNDGDMKFGVNQINPRKYKLIVAIVIFLLLLSSIYLYNNVFFGPQASLKGDDNFEGGGIILGSGSITFPTKGCNTAFYFDEDCDSFGVGVESTASYSVVQGTEVVLYGDRPDAIEGDATVNTPQSVALKYSNRRTNDINLLTNTEIRTMLFDKGYNVVNDIYYVDNINGYNPMNARINDIRFPYISPRDVFGRLTPGDIMIVREGQYRQFNIQGVVGTLAEPIVIMSFPGELVEIRSEGNAIAFNEDTNLHTHTSFVTVDGFVLIYDRNNGGSGSGDALHFGSENEGILVKNIEIPGGNYAGGGWRWGGWSSGDSMKKNIWLDNILIHNIHFEHGIYLQGIGAIHEDVTLTNSLIYGNRQQGFQLNGRFNEFVIKGNIFHSNGNSGISLVNGAQNGIIENNLIYNNDAHGITMQNYQDVQHCAAVNRRAMENIKITNNIIWNGNMEAKTGSPRDPQSHSSIMFDARAKCQGLEYPASCCGSRNSCPCSPGQLLPNGICPCINFDTVPLPHEYQYKNIDVKNNIFSPYGSPVLWSFEMSHISEVEFDNNIFYRGDGGTGNGMQSFGTDGTHTSTIISNVRGMPETVYVWTIDDLQNHPSWRQLFRNNLDGDPGFADVSTSYFNTPELFNFDHLSRLSLGINRGISNGAPIKDIRGNSREGNVDLGAYELISGGGGGGGGNELQFVQEKAITWSPLKELTDPQTNSKTPTTDSDSQGNIHIAWINDQTGNNELYYMKLRNDGQTLIMPTQKTTTTTPTKTPQLKIDNQDRVHIIYVKELSQTKSTIQHLTLNNNGQIIRQAPPITNSNSQSLNPQFVIDQNDDLHITWEDNRNGNKEIYYEKRNQNGNNIQNDYRITNDIANSQNPAITTNTNNIDFVWEDDRSGTLKTYYIRTTQNLQTVIPTRIVDNGPPQTLSLQPKLQTDSNEFTYITWNDGRSGSISQTYLSIINLTGQTFINNYPLITNQFTINPISKLDQNNNAHLTWQELSTTALTPYYAKIDGTGTTTIPPQKPTTLLTNVIETAITTDDKNKPHLILQNNPNNKGTLYHTQIQN